MDPFLQAGLTLVVGLATLVLGFVYVIPWADRLLDRWERRHLPPAE